MSLKSTFFTSFLLAADLVAGHGAIIAATGDAGGTGMALGIDTSTPRDGTRRRPFQQDTTRFRGDAEDTVGETLAGGDNDVESGTQAILEETGDSLPQITPGGELQMTLHQVNSDGAGPYTCMINDDGTATTWQDIPVTQNVPGDDGRDRDGEATDFPLTASIPQDQQCSGSVAGQENVCLVRCENPARAGPFGGVVPVQMAMGGNGGNGSGNGNGNNVNNNNNQNNGNNGNTGNNGNGNEDNTNNNNNGNGNNGNDSNNTNVNSNDTGNDGNDNNDGNNDSDGGNSPGDGSGNGSQDGSGDTSQNGSGNNSGSSYGNNPDDEDGSSGNGGGNNSENDGGDDFEARLRLAKRLRRTFR